MDQNPRALRERPVPSERGGGELAAPGPVRQDLPRVHPAVGIERRAQACLRTEVLLGEDERHEVALLQSDPVLARQRSTGVDAQADDLVGGGEHAFQGARDAPVEREERVEVPVSGVEHVRDDQVVPPRDRVDTGEGLGELRPRITQSCRW